MFVLILITAMMMLMSIPSVRTIGVTLAASAGVAGLAIGAAAQPALKNLIAGIQMAFTEPIRIDDVVIIDNEWGRIEDIRLTYVVVRIWTTGGWWCRCRSSSRTASRTGPGDECAAGVGVLVSRSRRRCRPDQAKLEEVVRASPRWDQRFFNCQVTDSKQDGLMEVRGLMTAKDASTAFDLRCEVREAIYAFIRDEMPEALPRTRIMPAPPPSPSPTGLPSAPR